MRTKITALSKFDIMVKICDEREEFGVYINTTNLFKLNDYFEEQVNSKFSKTESKTIIKSLNDNKELILFECGEDASKLFNIMKMSVFNSVYSVLISPHIGIMETN